MNTERKPEIETESAHLFWACLGAAALFLGFAAVILRAV